MPANDFGVVLGVSHYVDLARLDGPQHDASAFRSWLVDGAGVPPENIEFVAAADDEGKPVAAKLADAFEQIVDRARDRGASRRLYVYFAGHGIAASYSHLVLLAANAAGDKLNHGLNTREYRDGLASVAPFSEQLFFFDCCRKYDWVAKGTKPPWTPITPQSLAVKQYTFYASEFQKSAYERAPVFTTMRGLFSRALISGLEGAAAVRQSGDWVVTTDSLARYLQRKVPALAAEHDLHQEPQREFSGPANDLVIVTVSAPVERSVTFELAPEEKTLLVFTAAYELVAELMAPATTVGLAPGQYMVLALPSRRRTIVDVDGGIDRLSVTVSANA
ncbi:caspase family protein [Mycobacterium yunnanensis]|uniref:Caspase family protein n=1 Tax=Mycobacterium yunnanensis TaxID=368477 RepID=A0A9X3BW31_9MYCO|nr:caspase family protein [Mycobacterium yunnanensis]MCV7423950.1 caspase family protein [Mycobacterium yunnanensis]